MVFLFSTEFSFSVVLTDGQRPEWKDLLSMSSRPSAASGRTCLPCRPDRAQRVEGSAFMSSRPSAASGWIRSSCHPDRAQRVEGSVVPAPLSPKEEWKNAHANKNAFAAFSIPLFFVQRCHVANSLSPRAGSLLSFMSPRASVERSDGKGRFFGSGPSDLRSE